MAENRLLDQRAHARNQIWVGDITCLPLVGGRWCYPATWRAACSRRVIDGHLAAQMPAELVLKALEQALTLRQPRASSFTPTAAASIPATPAASGPKRPARWLAAPSRATPTITPRPKQAGARSKPSCYPTAGPLPASKVAYDLDTYFNLDRRHSALGYRSLHQF